MLIIHVLIILRNYPCKILLHPVIVLGLKQNFDEVCGALLAIEYFRIWTIIKEIQVDLLHLCIIPPLLMRDFQ